MKRSEVVPGTYIPPGDGVRPKIVVEAVDGDRVSWRWADETRLREMSVANFIANAPQREEVDA